MRKTLLLFHSLLLFTQCLFSQSVGIGTEKPDSVALLDLASNTKGILIPRLTSTQRNNIVRPPEGLMIYNVTTNNYNVFDGSSWKAMQKELPAGVQLLSDTGISTLGELGFSHIGNMYLSYRPPSVPVNIPDSTWYQLNQNDPDLINTPAMQGVIIWIGTELLYLSPDSNFRFNLTSDRWTKNATTISGGSSSDIWPFTNAVWTGSEVIWWNGTGSASSKVFRFNPQTNLISIHSVPFSGVSRESYTIIWTGSSLIVWGGDDFNNNYLNDGGIYNTQTNTWTYITVPAPLLASIPARIQHTAIWTGLEMIVWGGKTKNIFTCPFPQTQQIIMNTNTGFRFAPNTLLFTPLTLTGPEDRRLHSAVWSGSHMIIYGGKNMTCGSSVDQTLETGSKYNPTLNTWTPTANHSKKYSQNAFWISNRMILVGHSYQDNSLIAYDPVLNSWKYLSPHPYSIFSSQSFWTGDKLIVISNELYAYSTTPVTLMQAPSRRETKLSVWRKN